MCFGGREKTDEVGVARSRELDKAIRADEKRMAKEVKLLLLGTHCCLWWRHGGTSLTFLRPQAPESPGNRQSSNR